MGVVKVMGLDVKLKHLVPQREAEACKLLLNCISLCQGWGYDGSVSQGIPTCFDVDTFSFIYVYMLLSYFLDFCQRNCPICSFNFGVSIGRTVQEPPLSSLWNFTRLILSFLKMCVCIFFDCSHKI